MQTRAARSTSWGRPTLSRWARARPSPASTSPRSRCGLAGLRARAAAPPRVHQSTSPWAHPPAPSHAPPPQATFALRVTAPPAPWVVLSNMPVSSRIGGRRRGRALLGRAPLRNPGRAPRAASDTVTHIFEPSPRMPTYLVAWVVGRLEHVTMDCQAGPDPERPLPVSVWATPDRRGGTSAGWAGWEGHAGLAQWQVQPQPQQQRASLASRRAPRPNTPPGPASWTPPWPRRAPRCAPLSASWGCPSLCRSSTSSASPTSRPARWRTGGAPGPPAGWLWGRAPSAPAGARPRGSISAGAAASSAEARARPPTPTPHPTPTPNPGPRGLIMYRESRLLVDPKEGDLKQVGGGRGEGRCERGSRPCELLMTPMRLALPLPRLFRPTTPPPPKKKNREPLQQSPQTPIKTITPPRSTTSPWSWRTRPPLKHPLFAPLATTPLLPPPNPHPPPPAGVRRRPRRGARGGALVVWRPRHAARLERAVAERGLRHLL
jgi:hypothetical protein